MKTKDMTIEMTVIEIKDTFIILTDSVGKKYDLPKELFPGTVQEQQKWWITVSEQKPISPNPKEILNEILGTTS